MPPACPPQLARSLLALVFKLGDMCWWSATHLVTWLAADPGKHEWRVPIGILARFDGSNAAGTRIGGLDSAFFMHFLLKLLRYSTA
jgi:hypothetical protein